VKIDLTELLRKVGSEADIVQTEKLLFTGESLVLTQPVKLQLHLVNTGTSVLLSGNAETEVELECSRCLKSFGFPIAIKVKEEFSKLPFIHKKGKELELREEDFVYPIEKDNTIDLSEIIRQDLLLALPIQPLCKEKCKGIKPE